MYDAHPVFERALRQASREMMAEQCYASAYQALAAGKDKDAKRLFGVLTTMTPRDERSWIGLAVCYERRANWALAAALYGMGTVVAKHAAWSHFGRARALKRLGKRSAALQAFRSAEAATTDPALLAAIDDERSAP